MNPAPFRQVKASAGSGKTFALTRRFLELLTGAEADSGRRRDLLSSEEREELKRLRKENSELRRANAILKDASVYFAQELDPTRRR